MRCVLAATLVWLSMSHATHAATFTFDTDPFAGSTAPTTPGRQIVGGEPFITFDPATDVFVFDPVIFNVSAPLSFYNGLGSALPASGAEVIVLQDSTVPFNAGLAANLIAGQVTTPGAGFFIYFNSGLDLPRLVYSPNLDDETSDLKIMARMTNLGGQAGRDSLASFTTDNFSTVPEPASLTLCVLGAAALIGRRRSRSARHR